MDHNYVLILKTLENMDQNGSHTIVYMYLKKLKFAMP